MQIARSNAIPIAAIPTAGQSIYMSNNNPTLTETDLAERADFLASCDADERAEAEEIFRLIDEAAAG